MIQEKSRKKKTIELATLPRFFCVFICFFPILIESRLSSRRKDCPTLTADAIFGSRLTEIANTQSNIGRLTANTH